MCRYLIKKPNLKTWRYNTDFFVITPSIQLGFDKPNGSYGYVFHIGFDWLFWGICLEFGTKGC